MMNAPATAIADGSGTVGYRNCRVPKSSFVSGVRLVTGLPVAIPTPLDSIRMSTPAVVVPGSPNGTWKRLRPTDAPGLSGLTSADQELVNVASAVALLVPS